jgi:hypothetical protein
MKTSITGEHVGLRGGSTIFGSDNLANSGADARGVTA